MPLMYALMVIRKYNTLIPYRIIVFFLFLETGGSVLTILPDIQYHIQSCVSHFATFRNISQAVFLDNFQKHTILLSITFKTSKISVFRLFPNQTNQRKKRMRGGIEVRPPSIPLVNILRFVFRFLDIVDLNMSILIECKRFHSCHPNENIGKREM